MSLQIDADGFYIIDDPKQLREWYRMTDLSHIERLSLKSEMNPKPKKVVKTTKKVTKKVETPEQTDFDKWFNYK
jgi:hypothetical protein